MLEKHAKTKQAKHIGYQPTSNVDPTNPPKGKKAGFILKDSGERESFDGGAVRDIREGKGRFDLITPIGLRRLAVIYEKGSEKYDDRNWEKGIPFSRCLDSAERHINQFKEGYTDEDHLAQAAWNLFALLHFSETRPDLDDVTPHAPLKQKD